jgi:outer membrane lipoprotein-sorting protein
MNRILLFLCRFYLAASMAVAFLSGAASAANLNPEQLDAVEKVTNYLNSFASLQGEFTQISPRGQMSKGVVLISKPGKMRFEYAPPSPLLIVSDGKWLTVKNRVKEKGDQFPLSSTPLRLVVAPKVDLLRDTDVKSVEMADGLTTIVVEDKKDSLGGYLILVFDDTQNVLQQWIVVDGKGRRTTVQLVNLETNVKIDPKLFNVKINRKEKNSR